MVEIRVSVNDAEAVLVFGGESELGTKGLGQVKTGGRGEGEQRVKVKDIVLEFLLIIEGIKGGVGRSPHDF